MVDATIQRATLLNALRLGPVSSIQAREGMGILSPAARVMELRRGGFPVEAVWKSIIDAQGRRHRSGVYVMVSS